MSTKPNGSRQPTIRLPDFNQFAECVRSGKTIIPLQGKAPTDKGWTTRAYPPRATLDRIRSGGLNAGWRIPKGAIALDPDGEEGLRNLTGLQLDTGFDPTPYHRSDTGGGGMHILMRVPPDFNCVGNLAKRGYRKIDVKKHGGQIVIPGSVHDKTGRMYGWQADSPRWDTPLLMAPDCLLATLQADAKPETDVDDIEDQDAERAKRLLNALNATDYSGDRDEDWLNVSMAFKAAGGRYEDWVEWNATDPEYQHEEAVGENETRWNSIDERRKDGITGQTLEWYVREAGRAGVLAQDDFADDPPEISDDDEEEQPSKIIRPSPFVCVRPQDIPQRRFLLRPNYVRKFLSLTTAIGGVGKSKLVMAELTAIATGRDLLGVTPEEEGLRCWYWNGEDPKDELQRQIQAIMLEFKIEPYDLAGRLFVDSGRELPIKIAELHKGETRIAKPVIKQMIEAIHDNGIDVLAIDPFVSSHNASENDNVAMERVAKTWAHIADETNCSIQLVHHNRKTGGEAGTIEDARGATALNYAARARRAINTMTAKQAKAACVREEERRHYLSADNSNSNMIAPGDSLRWYRLVSVNLGNGPAGDGDRIGVVTPWTYPTTADTELSDVDKAVALGALKSGGPWRKDPQSEAWIGRAIAEALGLDLTMAEDVKGIKATVAEWIEAGTLEEHEANDKRNRPRAFLKLST